MKFKEWFDKCLIVSSYPKLEEIENDYKDIDIIINVSDEYYHKYTKAILLHNKMYFWLPMNEGKRDIGLNSIFGALMVLWEAEKNNQSVLLHCHAGANRSPSVQQAYYFMRTNTHLEPSILGRGGYINQLVANCTRGYLPPKAEMEQFLNKCKEAFDNPEKFIGGMLDWCKSESINNF